MNDKVDHAIYKDFLDDKKIIINETIDDSSVSRVTMMIKKWNIQDDREEMETMCSHCSVSSFDRTKDPIKIYINSPGGCYTSSMSIVSAILASKTPVETYVIGEASSGAFLIAIAGHKRYAQRFARLMFHNGTTKVSGEVTLLNSTVDEINRSMLEMFNYVVERTNLKMKELREKTQGKDWYFTAAEAKAVGIIDEVE